MEKIWKELCEKAKSVICPKEISANMYAGSVGAAVLTKEGNIYTGVCIDTSCSLGMCAERNALSTMITHGEYEADKVVAIFQNGEVMSPCGACREFMMQLKGGENIQILLNNEGKVKTLGDLMPDYCY